MKRSIIFLLAAFFCLGPGLIRAASPNCYDTNFTYFETASRVSVSTTPTSATKILTAVSGPSWVWVRLQWSGSGTLPNSEFLLLSQSSTTFSVSTTTGTARIVASNEQNNIFEIGCYSGDLYAVVTGTTAAQNVEVFRKR